LRGIEKYVVENKAFLASNASNKISWWTRVQRRFIGMIGRSPSEQESHTQALHQYIHVLNKQLKESGFDSTKADELRDLLMDMTCTDPNKRISAETAAKRYQSIFGS
jgi:hypothetical protein